jgi:hypothetical protein
MPCWTTLEIEIKRAVKSVMSVLIVVYLKKRKHFQKTFGAPFFKADQ